MSWSIDFSPMVPTPLLLVASLAAVLLIGALVLRRSRGVVLRALAVAAVL